MADALITLRTFFEGVPSGVAKTIAPTDWKLKYYSGSSGNQYMDIQIPIIVRLQGTNAEEAKKLIDESGLKVQSAILLSEAAELVKKAVA